MEETVHEHENEQEDEGNNDDDKDAVGADRKVLQCWGYHKWQKCMYEKISKNNLKQ